MKVSEAFLVNTKNFDSIIETLVKHEEEEPVINSALLEELGYSDPNDLLVVRLLKDFDVIDNDGEPSTYFKEFKNPKTTKNAIAKGLIHAYKPVFEEHPQIHQRSPEKIKSIFDEIFKGQKTDLIIKYISGTFHKVVSYAGVSTIDSALKNDGEDSEPELEPSTIEAEATNTSTNGQHHASDSEEGPQKTNKEISDKNIDDLVNDFDAKKAEKDADTSDEDDDGEDEQDNLTVQEYVKDDSDEEDNPFDFDDDETAEITLTQDQGENIDMDPFELETPLSSATQTTDSMSNITAEHDFVPKALIRKSDLLHKMQRWEELVPTLEEIIKRYDDDEHPKLSDAVSRSIIRRATALLKLHKTDEALEALNTVIDRFEESEKKEFFDQASRAMLFKATLLEKNGSSNLLPLYNKIIDRMDSNADTQMKEKLDGIHLKRFDLILAEGEYAEILNASSELIERFKGTDEHREYLQKAMIKRAEILDDMGQDEEALKAYDEFLEAFGG